MSNPVGGAERLIVHELSGDNVLLQAWERFADYDLNAGLQQRRFDWIQGSILAIGLLATFFALSKEVFAPKPVNGVDQIGTMSFWWFIRYLLIIAPILLTIMITAASRFKQGNKWLLLRAGAEAIKREIYRYRARAGDYKEVFIATLTQTAEPGAPPPLPPPTPDQVLAQRVEDVTRRVMRTEVNSSSLIPYDKSKGFPPYMYAAQGGDDGFGVLSPDRYIQFRLGDQLSYYKRKAVQHERKLKKAQWSIFIIGGLGTFLAAIDQQVWIALTTALAAALTTYLSYKQTENTLTKYNQAATDLENVKSWWTALPPAEQTKQESLDALVDHTERVLQSELDGWVQQMQNALAELRKGQAQATEKAEPAAGGGPAAPQTDEEKAAAAKAAADQAPAAEAGEVAPGEATSGENAGGDASGAENAGGEDTGGDTAEGGNAEGEDAGGNAAVGENAEGEDTADEQTPGDKPVG
ncbi:MAG: DUF4231 domain-containing protein [Pyrinomonadaceae bacterium]